MAQFNLNFTIKIQHQSFLDGGIGYRVQIDGQIGDERFSNGSIPLNSNRGDYATQLEEYFPAVEFFEMRKRLLKEIEKMDKFEVKKGLLYLKGDWCGPYVEGWGPIKYIYQSNSHRLKDEKRFHIVFRQTNQYNALHCDVLPAPFNKLFEFTEIAGEKIAFIGTVSFNTIPQEGDSWCHVDYTNGGDRLIDSKRANAVENPCAFFDFCYELIGTTFSFK